METPIQASRVKSGCGIAFFPHHDPGSTNILMRKVRSLIVENSNHGRYLKHYCIIKNIVKLKNL